ncbi:MAG: hypothetical protein CEN91_118 [Candidatus Berkelbacteria bacterium Licking1014_85]|uniref:Uncharacterized protein n=1 Tax=Candidatus Berkelbacteria bacterium Licking1014_85 TaxID=2017148 RepID=A0A554LLM5_9BACT|nr:MAG: hypothetical protein CEN91_118 [Candidatus Berkelbacteria bacterium Licking1014_85]
MPFLSWLYKDGVKTLVNVCVSVLLLTYDNFSISELLRTLFYPWRKDSVKPLHPTLQMLFQAWTLNLIARLIGFAVRISVIFVGIVIIFGEIIFALCSLLFALILPISLPLLYIVSILWLSDSTLFYAGILLVVIAFGITFFTIYTYISRGLKHPTLPYPLTHALAKLHAGEKIDLEPFMENEAKKIFLKSASLQDLKKHLLESSISSFIFARTGLNRGEIETAGFDSAREIEFLKTAGEFALKLKHQRIEVSDLILALAHFDHTFKQELESHDISYADMLTIIRWQTDFWKILHPKNQLVDPKNLRFTGGIGKNWASGYTPILDTISHDITQSVSNESFDFHHYAHKNTIDKLERILSRSGQKNAVLVGPEGVGKKTAVLGLARRIFLGKTLAVLAHKKMIELDLSSLLNSSQNPESAIISAFNEAVSAGNIVVYIDHLERLLADNNSSDLGSVNALGILAPYLKSGSIQIIGSSDPSSWQKIVNSQPAIADYFEKIEVSEPDVIEVISILLDIAPYIENSHKTFFTFSAIKSIYELADRYIANRSFPQKAIDLLDETATEAQKNNLKIITPQIASSIMSEKLKVNVGSVENNESQALLHLEDLIHERVINQDKAIKAIASALRRSRSGVGNPNKPIGSFMFLGPTGVGKTETAKALAATYFNDESRMIRLDMSEYQEIISIENIIGSSQTATGGRLTDAVKANPYSLILLDEIEKAHPSILNLFLQMLDEGWLTDALNQKVEFNNCIIIATSNAGSNFIRQEINRRGASLDMEKLGEDLTTYLQDRGIFKPKFVNRFDAVVSFRPLKIEELTQVVDLLLDEINQNLSAKNYSVALTDSAKKLLAAIGFDPKFGARALNRAMNEYVSDLVANAILSGKISHENPFEITDTMIREKMI